VPRGIAHPAPLTSSDALLEAWFEIVRTRLEATLLERGILELDDSTAVQRRARADHLEHVLAQRLAVTADPLPLALAVTRFGIADPLASIAVLLGYELDERVAMLAAAADAAIRDPGTSPMRIGALAAARSDRSVARALDAIEQLSQRGLAAISHTAEPARCWAVRADRRWFPVAAGRLAPAGDLPLRELATADRWLAHARGRRRTLRVLGEVTPVLLVREATLLAAAVAFAEPPPSSVTSALTAAGIPVILDDQDE
jgi:hypothetical protein